MTDVRVHFQSYFGVKKIYPKNTLLLQCSVSFCRQGARDGFR